MGGGGIFPTPTPKNIAQTLNKDFSWASSNLFNNLGFSVRKRTLINIVSIPQFLHSIANDYRFIFLYSSFHAASPPNPKLNTLTQWRGIALNWTRLYKVIIVTKIRIKNCFCGKEKVWLLALAAIIDKVKSIAGGCHPYSFISLAGLVYRKGESHLSFLCRRSL